MSDGTTVVKRCCPRCGCLMDVSLLPAHQCAALLNYTDSQLRQEVERLRSQLAAALAKVEEAERDAERYRWLRVDSPGSRVVAEQMEDLVETDLDAAIDAAMPAKEGG